jgi:hypothetical protein
MIFSRDTDVHVHLAALPDGANGCWISPSMLKSPVPRVVARRLGLDLTRPAEANRAYLERLLRLLRESTLVNKAVILGLDGVYGPDGRLERERTDFLIPNDYVLDVARRHSDCLLPGVSINPRRRDALDELARCASAGASLIKVLPNTQQFDPSDAKHAPFYRALATTGLPILTHSGFEFSLWGKDQSVGDLIRWQSALEAGATVISAHGASHGLYFMEKNWATLREFVRRYPHFYWDASALSLPNRVGMLLRLRRHPELIERMLFGTDYPLPSFAYPALLAGRPGLYWELRRTKNPFDRMHRLMEALTR